MEADAAIGPPAGMVEKSEELTPMLSQYFELCTAYEDSLILFQVGDFYEAFCEAAEVISRELEITLTKREDSTGTYPMAGIPVDSAASYIKGLLDAGFRVAVADQVQDPAEASGPVDRAITRVVTPGTVIEDDLLEAGSNNYVACLAAASNQNQYPDSGASPGGNAATGPILDDPHAGRDRTARNDCTVCEACDDRMYAVAFADVSTGEFLCTSSSRELVADELERFDPSEILLAPEVGREAFAFECMVTPPREGTFEVTSARDRVEAYGHGSETFERPAEVRACGALLAYVEYTQGDVAGNGKDGDERNDGDAASEVAADAERPNEGGRSRFGDLVRYDPRQHLRLDATALRSLEVFENRQGGADHTLLSVLDETSCALGRRRLTGWLRRPLLDPERIDARLDAVAELVRKSLVREELRDLLRDVYDIERLLTRVSRGRANARDLRSLKDTLDAVPRLREALAEADSRVLIGLRDELDELGDVRGLIGRAIRPEPSIEVTEGGLIQWGFDGTLDTLRGTEREGREWVADLETTERERTGIESLSVGFNQVHGYYIEVTKANLDRVPEEYTRRQTLKNAERFYTPTLKKHEDEILSAGERADKREYDCFRDVRAAVAAEADRVSRVADALADLDALSTLAAVATEREYARPAVGANTLKIEAGRHPVVETVGEFVPNDARLKAGDLAIVTGPNMSGKSTYMRQIALCVLLAQIGSFVPARSARLPIVDRIFTRIGASDDIAGGQSTFMREMTELTTILRNATADSLVLLDEVGRGTSTADGRAIARAGAEYVHDAIGARTLFATHYHELTDLATDRERVHNLHFTVDGDDGSHSGSSGERSAPGETESHWNSTTGGAVTFLHTVAEGASSSSYGIDVAVLAGVPEPVVERSRELVADANSIDGGSADDGGADGRSVGKDSVDDGPVGEPDDDGPGPTHGADASYIADDAPFDIDRARRTTNGQGAGDTNRGESGIGIRDGRKWEANGSTPGRGTERESGDMDGEVDMDSVLAAELSGIDLATTTPIEALNHLDRLKRRLDDRRDRQTDGDRREREPNEDR